MTKSNKTLSEKISLSIKAQQLKPIPKGVFVFHRLMIWIILSVSIITSAATLSMIIFRTSKLRNLPYENIPISLHNQFLDMVPIIFIITLVVGIVIAIYEFGKTNSGYKFEKLKVSFSVFVCIVLLASLFSYLGINHSVHRIIVGQGKLAPSVEEIKNKRFNNPQRGIIVGIVKDQILITKSGEKINLIRGERINPDDFLNIHNLEQPVILFGKPVPDGFIVCKLSRQEKIKGMNLKKKKSPINMNDCKKAPL